METSLRILNIASHYEGLGERLTSEFIIPALRASVKYDRLTSFFTTESMIACADGIDDLWIRQGHMRLILGIHAVPGDLAEAASSSSWVDALVATARISLVEGCRRLTDEFARNRIGTLAMMLRDGFLEVKVAAPRTAAGQPTGGILHSKRYIFHDSANNTVVAVGSPNETRNALSGNYEELAVDTSWDDSAQVIRLVKSFENIWENRREDLEVRSLDQDFADELLSALGDEITPVISTKPSNGTIGKLFELIRQSPEFAFTNVARAALFPHQERALRDAASRWPIRVILADEVGLGKTIEAGSLIAYTRRFLGVRRILVLTPAGLRRQWQSELLTHFGIKTWQYESDISAYVDSAGNERKVGRDNPLDGAPDVILVSWQLARNSWRSRNVFENAAWTPDLILVDEAHSARRNRGFDKRLKTTLVWDLIQSLGQRCPHLVLLTATPMQIQMEEYHGLLMLLGMPKWWMDADNFVRLLEKLDCLRESNELAVTQLVADGVASGMALFANPSSVIDTDSGLTPSIFASCPVDRRKLISLTGKGHALKNLAVYATPPATLTVRNTRRGLESIGYRFPKRQFKSPSLIINKHGVQFIRRVDAYLNDIHGKVEIELGLSKGGASAFIRSVYYQRFVSSLASANKTLERRTEKLAAFLSSGRWEQGEQPDDELDDEATAAEETTRVDDKKINAAKQLARIEIQYLQGMRRDLDGAVLDGQDPKLIQLRDTIADKIINGDAILVFSRFTDTVDACIIALESVLIEMGVGYGRYTGGESWVMIGGGRVAVDKSGLCDALRKGAIKVIFCSDAASEGLNLQSARCLINVDVPWNPARLEQRIGRIARLGQKSPTVEIYNLWYPGTLEEHMYSKLLDRQELYDLAVGEFPDVVGEEIRRQLQNQNNYDSSDIEHRLNELRSKSELAALQRIWSRSDGMKSCGGEFREMLFSIVERVAIKDGGVLSKDGTKLKVQIRNKEFIVDSAAGQADSLTVYSDCLRLIEATNIIVKQKSFPEQLSVLCLAKTPVCLLVREKNVYHVLGPIQTLEVLEMFAIGSKFSSKDCPTITKESSNKDIIQALREAFHARVELGAIRFTKENGNWPEMPSNGDWKIIPFSNWHAN